MWQSRLHGACWWSGAFLAPRNLLQPSVVTQAGRCMSKVHARTRTRTHTHTYIYTVDSRYITVHYNATLNTIRKDESLTKLCSDCQLWTHKRHPIPWPYERVMGRLSELFGEKIPRDIECLHCNTSHIVNNNGKHDEKNPIRTLSTLLMWYLLYKSQNAPVPYPTIYQKCAYACKFLLQNGAL